MLQQFTNFVITFAKTVVFLMISKCENVEEVIWKEISESEDSFQWDLYCLEYKGEDQGLGWDHCIEVGDFYSMKLKG